MVLKTVHQLLPYTIIELTLEESVLHITYGGVVAQLTKWRSGSTHPMQTLLRTDQVETQLPEERSKVGWDTSLSSQKWGCLLLLFIF